MTGVLARLVASGKSAYLCGCWRSQWVCLSAAYPYMPARLRYGCGTVGEARERRPPEKCRGWTCLRSAEGDGGWLSAAAFGGGLVALAVKIAGAAPILALRASKGIESGTAKALVTMNDVSFGISLLPLAVMLSTTAIVAVRTGALPRWLGWGAAAVALGLLGALSAVVLAPSPPEWVFLPMLLFLLWTVAASVTLVRHAGESRHNEISGLHGDPAGVR